MAAQRNIPLATAWYLADLGEARGKRELFTKQSPQRLKALREHALIESAVSSNRIEGVTIDQSRVKAVVLGKFLLRDRDEDEVRGYRDALKLIHEQHGKLSISEKTIKQLHFISRAKIGDAGKYKTKASDIIEKPPDGRSRIRFKTVPAQKTGTLSANSSKREVKPLTRIKRLHWSDSDAVWAWHAHFARDSRAGRPFHLSKLHLYALVAVTALNLDFLCIHPISPVTCRVSAIYGLIRSHRGYHKSSRKAVAKWRTR